MVSSWGGGRRGHVEVESRTIEDLGVWSIVWEVEADFSKAGAFWGVALASPTMESPLPTKSGGWWFSFSIYSPKQDRINLILYSQDESGQELGRFEQGFALNPGRWNLVRVPLRDREGKSTVVPDAPFLVSSIIVGNEQGAKKEERLILRVDDFAFVPMK